MNFIPYGKQSIDTNDINEVCEVLKSDFLTTGPKVKEFEEKNFRVLWFKILCCCVKWNSCFTFSFTCFTKRDR